MIHYVFEVENLINHKTYIGQRLCPKNKSPKTDSMYMGSGVVLKQAKKKYGSQNFNKKILIECETKEEVNDWEKYFIARNRSKGRAEYNIADGGEGLTSEVARSLYLRDGYRQRASLISKQRWQNPLYRSKIEQIRRSGGFKRPATSDEAKKAQSIAAKQRDHSEYCKCIRCIETQTVYASIKEAAKLVGVNRECIAAACKGRQKRAANLHWEFVRSTL